MLAKDFTCRVIETLWVTPTVFRLRFEPLKAFTFDAGQFVSVIVPPSAVNPHSVKRCYSFASSPQESKKNGYYELCVKYVKGGAGTGYLASLGAGDTFRIRAPFGDMRYKAPGHGRSVCFIATGTGIAPFRSMILSDAFKKAMPKGSICISGVRTEDEVIYREELDQSGIQTVYAVSKPTDACTDFKGRVTDFLKTLPVGWHWHTADFYLCGNGEMVAETSQFLQGGHGVKTSAIHKEAFSAIQKTSTVEVISKKMGSRS